MKITKKTNGYSKGIAEMYISNDKPVYLVSSYIEKQFKYVDKQRTENVNGFKLWFVQETNNPFSVKFDSEPVLPKFMSIIEFEILEGIEIRSNVYFRAEGLKVVK